MATLQSRLSLRPVGEGDLDFWEGASPTWAESALPPHALVCVEGKGQRQEEVGD